MRLAADCNYTKTCFPVAVIYFVDIGINPEGGFQTISGFKDVHQRLKVGRI